MERDRGQGSPDQKPTGQRNGQLKEQGGTHKESAANNPLAEPEAICDPAEAYLRYFEGRYSVGQNPEEHPESSMIVKGKVKKSSFRKDKKRHHA